MNCNLCESEAFYTCGDCADTHYCGKACQSADWSVGHELICRKGGGGKKSGKFYKVMREFKEGKLHSGSKDGPIVTDRKQALAIAYSESQ